MSALQKKLLLALSLALALQTAFVAARYVQELGYQGCKLGLASGEVRVPKRNLPPPHRVTHSRLGYVAHGTHRICHRHPFLAPGFDSHAGLNLGSWKPMLFP